MSQKDRTSILRPFHRHSAEERLEAAIKENGLYDIEDVENVMKNMEDKWKNSNNKVPRTHRSNRNIQLC